MIRKALRIGQLITNAHPSDVRLLFKAYNIKAEPTGKTIMDAYLVYGKPFLMKLIEIGYKSVDPISSATGDYKLETDKLNAYAAAATAKATADAAKAKGSVTEGIMKWFETGATGLALITNGYTAFSNMFQGKAVGTGVTDPNAAIQSDYAKAMQEAQAAESANSTKTYLLIGTGLLVAVLVGIMFLKRKQ